MIVAPSYSHIWKLAVLTYICVFTKRALDSCIQKSKSFETIKSNKININRLRKVIQEKKHIYRVVTDTTHVSKMHVFWICYKS